MRERKRLIAILLMMVLVLSVFTGTGTEAKKKKKLKFSKTKITMQEGSDTYLKIKNASSKKIKWRTSNKSVVSIEVIDGTKRDVWLTGEKPGNAVITAKIGKVKLKCKVKVKASKGTKPAPVSPIPTVKPTETPIPTVNPQDIYDANYDKVVAYIKEKGVLNAYGYISYGSSYGVRAETDLAGSFIYLSNYESASDVRTTMKLERGSSTATLICLWGTKATVNIRTLKGDGTESFDWENPAQQSNAMLNKGNASVYNMLKAVNGSYYIGRMTLKELGFESYVY